MNINNYKKSKNIQFHNESDFFNVRVIGACIKDGKILLGRMKHDKHWTLIGGKVKFGESSDLAVLREYMEETGAKLQIERLISVIENFFNVEDEEWHQFIFMYLLKDVGNELEVFNGSRKILDNENGIMQWFDINNLNNLIIKPNGLANVLVNKPKELIHISNRDI